MIKPWVTVPAKDMRIMLPMGEEDVYSLLFRDTAAIDALISDLQELRELTVQMDKVKAGDNSGE